jgi:hypothetical protein
LAWWLVPCLPFPGLLRKCERTDRQGDCNIAPSLSGGIIKSWLTFCDQYFWKFPIWNSRADEKRREIRMVKVNVIFNDIRLLICLTLLCKCVYTIGIPFRSGLSVIPQIPGSSVNSSVTVPLDWNSMGLLFQNGEECSDGRDQPDLIWNIQYRRHRKYP